MKINRKLIAAFACLSVVFGACTQTDNKVDAGVDVNAAGPNVVTYDEVGSSSSALAVYWDAAPAINAGATSFTVQLLKNQDETPDAYDASVSQTLLVNSNYVGSPAVQEGDKVACDQAVFANLAKGKIYYVRVRANYPMSKMSQWAFCVDENGDVARIKVGKGTIGPDEVEDKTAPTAKMVSDRITAGDAVVTWSTFNWANNSADFGMTYSLALKKGNELVVKWYLPADGSAAGIWKYAEKGCRWIFSGLDADTEYTVVVENTTDGVAADPVTFKTKASQVVTVPTAPAAAGDIILYEDFSDLIITGDNASYAAGYSYDKRSEMDNTWKATGDDPVKNDDGKGCYLVPCSTEVGMFNTIKGLVATTRLDDWGMQAEDNTKGAICARPGYVKMGASSMCAWLCTPELTCLAQPAQVELSFDAALYDTDPRTVIVEVLGGTTIDKGNNHFVTAASRFTVAQFEVGSVAGAWARYTFVIDGVMPGNRIAIGGDRNGVDGQHRFYLDNICVKVLSYGKLTLSAPENLVLAATDKTIDATWDAVANTKAYVVEYKAKSAAEWTALPAVAETNVTIEGLAFETEYEVRVKATADDVESEYSAVAAIKTLAEIKKLGTPSDIVAVSGISTVTLTFPAVLNATAYEVYAGATKLDSVASEVEGVVTVIAYGLAQESTGSVQVKAVAEGVEASDLSAAVAYATGKMFKYESAGLEYKPTSLTIEWTDFVANHAYTVQLADASGVLGTWNVKFGTSSCVDGVGAQVPSRFTMGALTPSTEYTVSVKQQGADDVTYASTKFVTGAVRAAGAKDIYWQGFDDCFFGGDSHNLAYGVVSKDADALKLINWPTTTADIYANVVSLTSVDGPGSANRTSAIQSYCFADPECSLYGWTMAGSEVHTGYVKFGAGGTIGVVTTNVLGDKVLKADAPTACTVEFKLSPRSDTNACTKGVKLVVVHADGSETVAASNIDPLTDGNSYNYTWKKISIKDVQLLSTDKLRWAGDVEKATGNARFHLDDILVVAQ